MFKFNSILKKEDKELFYKVIKKMKKYDKFPKNFQSNFIDTVNKKNQCFISTVGIFPF